jgi:hypothetical protein
LFAELKKKIVTTQFAQNNWVKKNEDLKLQNIPTKWISLFGKLAIAKLVYLLTKRQDENCHILTLS